MKRQTASLPFSVLLGGLLSVFPFSLRAQLASPPQPSEFQVELNGYAGTSSRTPFWLRANRLGIVPLTSPALLTSVRYALHYRKKYVVRNDSIQLREKPVAWGAGVNPVVRLGTTRPLILPEAYFKLKLGPMELQAGRWRQPIGVGDSLLSSGFVILSDNAIPVPKVQVATLGYAPIKFLKSFLAFNAGFAHGWFLDTYIQNSYLHQKYLYLRLGKPLAALKFYVGLNHQVQWGGHATYLLNSPFAIDGRLPSSLKDYANVVFAQRPKEYDTTKYTSFDNSYRIGNQVGSQDVGIEMTTRKARFLAYYQHPYEDVSGVFFQNLPDGLYGVSWQRLPEPNPRAFGVCRVVAEFLTTLNQSGAEFYQPDSYFQGNDNYFNHGQFKQGWSYQGRMLGTPFIMPSAEMASDVLVSDFFSDTRLQVYYLGAQGTLSTHTRWTTRLAYSRHRGTYNQPFPQTLRQFSFLLSAQSAPFKSKKVTLKIAFALDRGQLLNQTMGGSFAINYRLLP